MCQLLAFFRTTLAPSLTPLYMALGSGIGCLSRVSPAHFIEFIEYSYNTLASHLASFCFLRVHFEHKGNSIHLRVSLLKHADPSLQSQMHSSTNLDFVPRPNPEVAGLGKKVTCPPCQPYMWRPSGSRCANRPARPCAAPKYAMPRLGFRSSEPCR